MKTPGTDLSAVPPPAQGPRHRAEQRQGPPPAPGPARKTPAQVRALVRELETHQLELQMQNEELLAAQTAAEQARCEYADLYEHAPMAYVSLTAAGVVERVNGRARALLAAPGRLVGRPLLLLVAPASRPAFAELLAGLQRRDEPLTAELALQPKAGAPLVVRAEGLAGAGPPGARPCRLALFDVSAQHRAVAALAASEQKFRRLFTYSADAVVLLQDFCFVDANQAALRLLGAESAGQLRGLHPWDLSPDPEEAAGRFRRVIADALRDGSAQCAGGLRRFSGEELWAEALLTAITGADAGAGGPPIVHLVWRDVTAARRALRQSEERVQLALAASSAGVLEWACATNLIYLDERARTLVGLPGPPAHLPLAALEARVLPADWPAVAAALDRAAVETLLNLEFRVLDAAGLPRHLAAYCEVVFEANVAPHPRLTGLVRDITARREAEADRDYQSRLLAHMLAHAPVVLAQLSPAGDLESVGTGLRRLGVADPELRGRNALALFPAQADALRGLLAGRPCHFTSLLERAGQARHFQVYGFFDEQRQRAVLFGLDTTENHRLHEQATQARLRQQQAVFEAVLAAQEEERRRVAETLHNGVGQLLYLMKLHLEQAGPLAGAPRPVLGLLDEAIRDVRAVSAELAPPVLEKFGLNTALELMAKRVPVQILRVHGNFQGLAQGLAPPLQTVVYRLVQELLNNVLKHARAQEVFLHVVREGDTVFINVDDDGAGFDPQGPGKVPPGIGLAGIRSQVALLGGHLRVASRPGQGTSIGIELPAPNPDGA